MLTYADVWGVRQELELDAARFHALRSHANTSAGAASGANSSRRSNGSNGLLPLESVLLTVQVKADGKVNFYYSSGQGPAPTLIAQAQVPQGRCVCDVC
jgi:hypothetical protein